MADSNIEINPSMHLELELITSSFDEPVPAPFDFNATARAHGWVMLQPFAWDDETAKLSRIHRLAGGKVIRICLRDGGQAAGSVISVGIETTETLTLDEQKEVRRAVRRMLRLDEDFGEFYALTRQFDGWNLRLMPGAGRLLRCPNLFEDIIYTLCTTNIAWSGTIRMVERLVAKLGNPFPGVPGRRAFPTADAIAQAGPEFLKQETGLGYRSAYVWELAAAVVEGRLDLTTFESPDYPTDELHRALCQIKGVGDYAAATILMLLGRYEHLAVDSELRAFVTKKYFAGQTPSLAELRAIYEPWGRWKYLAYWFDALLEDGK